MSLREAVHRIEEGLIALILGVMTVLTFVQVVLRYGFNSGLDWQLESNYYLFAWLVMIGISYCVRVRAHIGVDAAVRLLPPGPRRAVGILVLLLALTYTVADDVRLLRHTSIACTSSTSRPRTSRSRPGS